MHADVLSSYLMEKQFQLLKTWVILFVHNIKIHEAKKSHFLEKKQADEPYIINRAFIITLYLLWEYGKKI